MLLERRRERLADELARASADGWLLYDFRGSNPAFERLLGEVPQSTRRAFLYIPRREQGEPRLLIHHVDAGNFTRLGLDVRTYGARDELLTGLQNLLGPARRVLMEYSPGNAIPYVSRVDAGTLELVRSLGVEVASSADALAAVVAAWDAADLASHQRAAAKLEQAKDALFSAMRSVLGLLQVWTEVDAQSFLLTQFEQLGLECDHPPIVAFNVHAGDPHYAPHPSLALQLKHGDLVLVDLWAREKARPDGGPGAYADITWMATAAETPPPEQMHIWETVRDARDTAVRFVQERLAAGQPPQGGEVDHAARDLITRAGYGPSFTHRTGHSIGWTAAHGDGVNIDDFETHDTRLLRPGAAFSIEPGIYLPAFGVRSEINVAISAGGQLRVTTPPQQDLVRLV
jgi:Xaa-Pro aminopeptidase